jgi:uncharacterized protein YndB with AHSA1/START domain
MTIAPIVQCMTVKAAPARAFDLFATRMADWWRRGKTFGKNPHAELVLEPRAGGRWFERDAEGTETRWGDVLTWEPPHRLLLAWRINSQWTYDPDFLTELEMTFTPLEGGGTQVRLEHRNLERFGADAAAHAAKLNGGWPTHMVDFARLADAELDCGTDEA